MFGKEKRRGIRKMKKFKVSEYEYFSRKISPEDDGFTIVQLSDLHNSLFGKENEILVEKIKEICPDVVFITGDFVDSRTKEEGIALSLLKKLRLIAPVFYVSGNHESVLPDYYSLLSRIRSIGATVLLNEKVSYKNFIIAGIDSEHIDEMEKMSLKTDGKLILALAHKPQFIKAYALFPIDLIFTGHAHGGQFRFPLIGGLYAPGQGIFPKYTNGIYREGKLTMVVSRGLGDGFFSIRINNPFDLVVCRLRRKN